MEEDHGLSISGMGLEAVVLPLMLLGKIQETYSYAFPNYCLRKKVLKVQLKIFHNACHSNDINF